MAVRWSFRLSSALLLRRAERAELTGVRGALWGCHAPSGTGLPGQRGGGLNAQHYHTRHFGTFHTFTGMAGFCGLWLWAGLGGLLPLPARRIWAKMIVSIMCPPAGDRRISELPPMMMILPWWRLQLFDLKLTRKRLGLSQKDLAGLLGVHEHTVSNWSRSGEMPKYARAYLGLALEIKDIAGKLRPHEAAYQELAAKIKGLADGL